MPRTEMEEFLALFDDSAIGVSDTVIEETRELLGRWIAYMRAVPEQAIWMQGAAVTREFSVQTLHRCSAFMFDPEMFVPAEFITENLNTYWFRGRFIFPVFTSTGVPCGLVGWDKFELPKYLDSRNLGYKAKVATLLGMERMREYLESADYVLFVEGSMDMCALLEGGFNALALLGSSLTPYIAQVIRRFGDRAVIIPDSDEAGNKLANSAAYLTPKARVLRLSSANDVDDCRKVNINFYTNLRKQLENPFQTLKL